MATNASRGRGLQSYHTGAPSTCSARSVQCIEVGGRQHNVVVYLEKLGLIDAPAEVSIGFLPDACDVSLQDLWVLDTGDQFLQSIKLINFYSELSISYWN